MNPAEHPILIRGAGELASGLAWHLRRSGFPVAMTERPRPLAVRRRVAFSSAVEAGQWTVEGVSARRCADAKEMREAWSAGEIALIVDKTLAPLENAEFSVLMDARMLKRADGSIRGLAPLTLWLGPGVEAGADADFVLETRRGHDLGRVIRRGQAAPNTGVPGEIGGESARRVLHSPADGVFEARAEIGELAEAGQLLGLVGGTELRAVIPGRLRGLLADGTEVKKGTKVADVDPRGEDVDPATISDKCRALAGGALTLILEELGR